MSAHGSLSGVGSLHLLKQQADVLHPPAPQEPQRLSVIRQHRHHNRAVMTGTVEFAEEEVLPAGQAQRPSDQRDRLRRAHQAGLEVGIAVAVWASCFHTPLGICLLRK